MFNIAICDDDLAVCNHVKQILLNYAEKSQLGIDVQVFHSGVSLIKDLKKGNRFNLIYLDIKMKKMNGVDAGLYIRQTLNDYSTEIVFITGTEGYERQLFDVHPLHFISKPIKESVVISDLLLALDRVKNKRVRFNYKKGHEYFNTPLDEIIYFESQGREIIIVTTKGKDKFYGNMTNILKEVPPEQFLLIHRSYLVNISYIDSQNYSEVTMTNGVVLYISSSKRKEIRSILTNK